MGVNKVNYTGSNGKNKQSLIRKIWNLSKSLKVIIFLVIIALIAGLIIEIINSKEGNLKFYAETTLEQIVEKNDLETVKYTYNAIAKQCKKEDCSNSKNNDDYKYFVSYEGTVNAGINFKEVKIDVDKETKQLIITVPEPKVVGYSVNIGSLKFIFTKDKYNEASELEKAYRLCKTDLITRSKNDELILKTAKQNSIIVLEAFFEPWIKNFNDEYKVIVK